MMSLQEFFLCVTALCCRLKKIAVFPLMFLQEIFLALWPPLKKTAEFKQLKQVSYYFTVLRY